MYSMFVFMFDKKWLLWLKDHLRNDVQKDHVRWSFKLYSSSNYSWLKERCDVMIGISVPLDRAEEEERTERVSVELESVQLALQRRTQRRSAELLATGLHVTKHSSYFI